MQNEIANIKNAYEKRRNDKRLTEKYCGTYSEHVVKEREIIYEKILRTYFANIKALKILEVGAGTGGNLLFFYQLGIPFANIFANELIEDRITQLKRNYPEINIIEGNAAEIEIAQKPDVIFQSTVFTSILNNHLRISLAKKMWEMLCDKGIILWYDFTYNNPNNKNVRKVTKKEIEFLFPYAKKYEFYRVTLAPPIGRKVGKLYTFFNTFKFLRTHLIAVIYK